MLLIFGEQAESKAQDLGSGPVAIVVQLDWEGSFKIVSGQNHTATILNPSLLS